MGSPNGADTGRVSSDRTARIADQERPRHLKAEQIDIFNSWDPMDYAHCCDRN
jgi:hypothetical protein